MSTLAMSDYVLGSNPSPSCGEKFVIWIDQVGAFILCLNSEVTIGGPVSRGEGAEGVSADVALLANLSRRHATLVRSGESYVLAAHAPAQVAGRTVHDRVDLGDGYVLSLGTNVRLKFRLPSVMSGTARLEFLSDHRPAHTADAIILMDETCLVGPGPENHIRCPGWSQTILLFRRDGQLWCKSRGELFINGRHAPDGGSLQPGVVVTGADIRFRLEGLSS